MGMKDPKPTYAYLASELKKRHPDLAYLHVVEPRVDYMAMNSENPTPVLHGDENDFLREIWTPKIYISAAGHTAQSALQMTAKHPTELVAFVRPFIANVSNLYGHSLSTIKPNAKHPLSGIA